MFITQVLCLKRIKWIPKVRPHGHLFRGKDRIVRKAKPEEILQAKSNLDIEERNMFYLRHPFLSAAEYYGVGKNYVKSAEKMMNADTERRMAKFVKTVPYRTIEGYFRERILKHNRWE